MINIEQKEKLAYMKLATKIAGYGIDNLGLNIIISLYELINNKKGNTNIKDIITTVREVEKLQNEIDICETVKEATEI
jgi:hypothetical protein